MQFDAQCARDGKHTIEILTLWPTSRAAINIQAYKMHGTYPGEHEFRIGRDIQCLDKDRCRGLGKNNTSSVWRILKFHAENNNDVINKVLPIMYEALQDELLAIQEELRKEIMSFENAVIEFSEGCGSLAIVRNGVLTDITEADLLYQEQHGKFEGQN